MSFVFILNQKRYVDTAKRLGRRKNDCEHSKTRSKHIKGSKERYLLRGFFFFSPG